MAVIAIKRNNRVYMAADRITSICGYNVVMRSYDNLKIRRIRDGILIGYCGVRCEIQNLYIHENWFRVPKGKKFNKEFLTTSVVENLIDILDEKKLLRRNKDGFPYMDSMFVIAKDDQLFLIDTDFGVIEVEEKAVITAGEAHMYIEPNLIVSGENVDQELHNIFVKCADDMAAVHDKTVVTDTVNEELRFYGGDY